MYFGTQNVLTYAQQTNATQFVLVSTDKAVHPISIYGASKLIAEELTRTYASSTMQTSIMRFGNVLGSRGSVVPLFQEQISMGGPITITSKDCKRYFMTISEACSLILYALQLNNTQKCNQYILEMGEQISVLDLAKQMLEFYGLEAEKDIPISFVGLRPGEKLSEALLAVGEYRTNTSINHIYTLNRTSSAQYVTDIDSLLEKLHSAVFYNNSLPSNYHNTTYITNLLTTHIPNLTLTV